MSNADLDTNILYLLDDVSGELGDWWDENSPIHRSKGFEIDKLILEGFLKDVFSKIDTDHCKVVLELLRIKVKENYLEFFKRNIIPLLIIEKKLIFNLNIDPDKYTVSLKAG